MPVEECTVCSKVVPESVVWSIHNSNEKVGYHQHNSNHTLFIKRNEDLVIYLVIYEDDMIITIDDTEEIRRSNENLFKEFEMKDLEML